MLGQNAVHAGMSGRTNMVIGYWNQYFVHIPISLTILKRKKVDPDGHLWQTVLETTGQARPAPHGDGARSVRNYKGCKDMG
jgi:6-phosphofructokinase 1